MKKSQMHVIPPYYSTPCMAFESMQRLQKVVTIPFQGNVVIAEGLTFKDHLTNYARGKLERFPYFSTVMWFSLSNKFHLLLQQINMLCLISISVPLAHQLNNDNSLFGLSRH